MKRLLAMLLVCVLVLSEFPVYADEASKSTMLEETTVAVSTDVVIDATEYGADPSGMKDSAEAIWVALEAAKEASENGTKSVTVYFPKGEYHVYKEVLRMNPNITLTLDPATTNVNTGETLSLNFQKEGTTNKKQIDNVFNFTKSKNVLISGNTYDDGMKNYVVADADTQNLKIEDEILTIVNNEDGAPSPAVGKVTFVNSNPDVLYVDEDGSAIGLKEGSATIYAYYEWNGTKIKSNEVTINVSGEALPVVDGKVTITKTTTTSTSTMNEKFSITREDAGYREMTEDSYTVDLQTGDLWTYNNTLKNLLLYTPDEVDKNDFRAIVKVTGLPVKESGQWDTASFILYKDDNNYITVGKKSHFDGFSYVIEKSEQCAESNGDSADNNVSVGYLGITYKDGVVTLSAKAEGGEWKTVATYASDTHTIGSDYKIGFGAWETNDRSKKVIFSDFKVGTSLDSFETLEAAEAVPFVNVKVDVNEEVIEIEKNPAIDDTGFKSNHAKLENITITELGFDKTATAEAALEGYYHVVAEEGTSAITLSATKDSESEYVEILHGDYRTKLSLKEEGNKYTTEAIALRAGINNIYVRVYAEDGITYKQYILCITYTPDYAEETLSDGLLKQILESKL